MQVKLYVLAEKLEEFMAKVYKEVFVNGKALKKWLEEYVVFEFDEDGNRILPEKDDERLYDFDENGKNRYLSYEFEEEAYYYDNYGTKPIFYPPEKEKIGNIIFENKDYNWKDAQGRNVFSVPRDVSKGKIEFSENKVTHILNNSVEYLFEYDGENLIHVKESDSSSITEYWFEYDDGKIIRKKDSNGWIYLYEYDENQKLIHTIDCNEDENKNEGNDEEVWYEYNSEGFLIQEKHSKDDGYYEFEIIYEYDSAGHLVRKSYPDGYRDNYEDEKEAYEIKYGYDQNGNLVCITDSSCGDKTVYEYDGENNMITKRCFKKSDGRNPYECYHWDSHGNIIFSKRSDCVEEFEYDNENNLICYKNYEDNSLKCEKHWDANGKLISFKDNMFSNNKEIYYEYDASGKLISSKDSTGEEKHWDLNGYLIYMKDSDGDEYYCERDEKGNITHFKNYEIDEWYEYEFNDLGNIKRKIVYRA